MDNNHEVTVPRADPASMLNDAIRQGINPEGIKILAEVYERMQAKAAEQEFNEALTAFQRECPVIEKRTEISFPTKKGGQFSSRFASMDNIIEQTRELRAKHGFSHSFEHPDAGEGKLQAVCILRHRGGYSTRTTFTLPAPKDFKISESHEFAGVITFCERYAFRAALGITTGLPDTDGTGFVSERLTEEQVYELSKLVDETKSDTEVFWKFAGVSRGTLDQLRASQYQRVKAALEQKKARKK